MQADTARYTFELTTRGLRPFSGCRALCAAPRAEYRERAVPIQGMRRSAMERRTP
jgi:hypothetical protein